jgi:hypothetical protein
MPIRLGACVAAVIAVLGACPLPEGLAAKPRPQEPCVSRPTGRVSISLLLGSAACLEPWA